MQKQHTIQIPRSMRRRQRLGKLLATYRIKAGYSQMGFSKLMGYDYAIAVHWENATHRLTQEVLRLVADKLQIPESKVRTYLNDADVVSTAQVQPTGSRTLPGLGERLKMIRQHYEYTMDDMAVLLDMCRSQYGRVEKGQNNLTLFQMQTIHKVMRIPYEQLFGDEPLTLKHRSGMQYLPMAKLAMG